MDENENGDDNSNSNGNNNGNGNNKNGPPATMIKIVDVRPPPGTGAPHAIAWYNNSEITTQTKRQQQGKQRTMAPKNITVVDASGKRSKELVGSQVGYSTLLKRLGDVACLVDVNEYNVNDFESLMDGDTYTLGPPLQQQQQQQQYFNDILHRIESKLDDMATIDIGMSKADQEFTRELLGAKGIVFKTLPVCTEVLDAGFADRMYSWGEKEDEKDGQPKCKAILERELLPLEWEGRALGIFDVRGLSLPEVREGKRKSNGFSDFAIGDSESLLLPDARDLTFGLSPALIELKTAKVALKQGQLLLQLVSLSTISNARKGVTVLGTDCARKWRLVYFTKLNEITIQQYTCGKKCLEDFSSLIQTSSEKAQTLVPPSPLPTIPETEFPVDVEDSANTSVYLDAVARHLACLFPSEREALVPVVDENHSPPSMIYL